MKYYILVISFIALLSCSRSSAEKQITFPVLLDEMINLERLAIIPEINYKTVQYSSYDRRSIRPTDSCWFSNEDGFGNEPIPGFEKVLKLPDENGIGEYLICDIQNPGAILRLWTAGLNGKIRLFLDDTRKPFFEGNAEDFFWKTAETLSGNANSEDFQSVFRQFDATYFPVPFSRRCRIEWIGDIKEIHFYHVGIRIYDPNTSVETFSPGEDGLTLYVYTYQSAGDKDWVIIQDTATPTPTLTPTPTPTPTPTKTMTPTPTFTPTLSLIQQIVGTWSFTLYIDNIDPGDAFTAADCNETYANETSYNSYLHLMTDSDGNVWGYTSNSAFTGESSNNWSEADLVGEVIDGKLFLESYPAAEGECQGAIIRYILSFDGNIVTGEKLSIIPGSGSCCTFEGKLVGERVE